MNLSNTRIQQLFRKEALSFPRYTLKENDTGIRLHQNETLGLSEDERQEFAKVLSRALSKSESINIYPSLVPTRLLQAYASALQVPVENVEVTSGSSQALTLLAEALFAPGRKVAVTQPSFSLFGNLARLYGAEVVDIELDACFSFDPGKLFSAKVLGCQVAILCSPNNPTGTVCSPEMILKFAERFSGMLIVDEAYVEFAQDPDRQSFVKRAVQLENVVVLRTLSKAWAAAGLRVGAMVSHRDNIALFRALKPPYSIAWPSEVLACHVLEHKSELTRARIARTVEQKNSLKRLLSECSQVEVQADSQANFVFFTTSKAAVLESALLEAGFLVRRYGSGRLAQAVRISMPPEKDFERLKNILIEVLR